MVKMWCGYVMTKADQMKNSTNDSAKEIKIKASDKLKHSGWMALQKFKWTWCFSRWTRWLMLFLSLWLPLRCVAAADVTLFSFGRSICPRFASLYILIIRDYHLSAFIVPFTVCETDETNQRFKIKVYCTLREHRSFCLCLCAFFSSFIYGRALTMCAEVISFNLCNQRGHIIIIIVIYPTFFLFLSRPFLFLCSFKSFGQP